MTCKAIAKFQKGNIKVGNMLTFSKVYGNDTFHSKYGIVKGTCGYHCAGCKKACYVRKSYRYPSVIDSHARNTIAMHENLDKAFNDLRDALNRKRKLPKIIRIHQSGEIETIKELLNWFTMAEDYPAIFFYLYTKNYNAVLGIIRAYETAGKDFPKNITVNVSVWHELGIYQYYKLQKYDFIKAFVYCDGYNYAADGLKIETMCMAYDKAGKMNHAITCDKCMKCIKSSFKVIGCYDH